MVAMVVGALVLAGLGTLGLTALDSVNQTQGELVVEARQLAQAIENEVPTGRHHDSLAVLRVLNVLKSPLELQGEAVLAVSLNGSLYNPLHPQRAVTLPSGLSADQIKDAPQFIVAEPVSGHRGRLAWAALLLDQPVEVGNGKTLNLVVVLTREAPAGVGSAAVWFGLASAVTVVVALGAAVRLGRRISRPLQQTEAVTGRIAAGDLAARVPVPHKEGRELVSLARSVNQMAANLAQAKGAQRQFLMSVSHDLRTPLTSIRGFAEAIADGTATDVHHATSIILSEAGRLERLVADLLELAKLETGTFSLQCLTLDLSAVVTEAAQAFMPAADALGLGIGLCTAGPGEVVCEADPDRLGQVVGNVVENALKYATSTVTVTTTIADGRPALVVEDDGPGIPAEDLGKVFKRLYQSTAAASRKLGSGLGLAIVDELVAAMGGTVRAESPVGPGGGTRMVVLLQPGSASLAAPEAAAAGPRPPTPH
jgi:two-component system sensor histidine kinase BaeS